ncbi:MAG: hypothetical protein AAF614_27560 [Chloroflexota bacterium]
MRKSVLFLVTILFFLTVLSVAAHDGEGETAVAANITLLAVSGGLSLLTVGIVYSLTTQSSELWQLGIISLTAFSGFIHIGFGLRGDTLLLLNGLGYLGLLALLILPFLAAQRQWLRGLLLLYTLVTFIGYFVLHTPDHYSDTALLTKAIEAGLLICLGVQIWQVAKIGREQTALA